MIFIFLIIGIAIAQKYENDFNMKVILIGSLLLIFVTEIINTSIEAVVDRISLKHHELSGYAKDLASTATFIWVIFAIIIWSRWISKQYNRRNKRLTSNNFLKMYKSILSHGGCVNLKTDSLFLHGYTLGLLEAYDCHVHFSSADIYSLSKIDDRLKIKTYYEKMFLKENLPISHIRFSFL